MQALAYLALFPLGTALGVATLVVLLVDRGKTASAAERHPSRPASTSVVGSLQALWRRPLNGPASVLAAMAIVGPGFVLAIALGYHFNEPRTPPELDLAALIALPIMLIAIFMLARSIMLHDGAPKDWAGIDFFYARQRRWARESRLLTRAEQQRVKHLRADPALRRYAELIGNGQHWSDDQIAYDQAPARLDSCEHLQPIERAMRAAGIAIRPNYNQYLAADCTIDYPELQRRFLDVREPVFYTDTIPGDRPYEPESAAIFCREHSSAIYVTHPNDARSDTPRFPELER
ncbi:MAG: hypothetical protein ABI414_11200 [Devosia sp.]